MVDILNKLKIIKGNIIDFINTQNIVLDPAGTSINNGIWDGEGVSGAIYKKLGIIKTKMNNTNSITGLKPSNVKINNFKGQYILHVHSPNGVGENEQKFKEKLINSYKNIFNEFTKHLDDIKKKQLVKPKNLVLVSVSGGIYCGNYCNKMPELTIEAIKTGFSKSHLHSVYQTKNYNIILINNNDDTIDLLTKFKETYREKTSKSITNINKKIVVKGKQKDLLDSMYNRFAEKDSCNLNQLLIAPLDYKCDGSSKNQGECDIKTHLLPLINSHTIFKGEKNRVFIEKYVKPQSVKYCKKNKTNLNSLIILLICIKVDISSIYKFIYSIHNYKYDKASNKFHNYKLAKSNLSKKKKKKDTSTKSTKSTKSKKNNFTSNSNNNDIFNEYKKDFETTIIKTLVDLLVEMIIIPLYYFNKYDTSKKKTTIKTDFEKVIKEIDTGNSLITSYKNFLNYKGKSNDDTKFDTEITSLKNKFISILSSDKTKNTINKLHELELLKEEQDSLLSLDVSFDEKRNSKYLFMVLGMLLFTILLKFNVLAY